MKPFGDFRVAQRLLAYGAMSRQVLLTATVSRAAAPIRGRPRIRRSARTGNTVHGALTPRPRPRRAGRGEQGFGLSELVVVLAVVGLIIAAGIPYFLVYLRNAVLTGGVQEVRDALTRAKQLAITTRQCICVEVASDTTYRFRQGAAAAPCAVAVCNGTAWTGVGTDASGYLRLENRVRISNGGVSPIFTLFGTAPPGPAIFTVTAPSGATRTVTVTGGGRISSP